MGAERRLIELAQEAEAIHAAFPELRDGRRRTHVADDVRPVPAASQGGQPHRKRRKMSAAARKRISDAQKARWAKQKAGKK